MFENHIYFFKTVTERTKINCHYKLLYMVAYCCHSKIRDECDNGKQKKYYLKKFKKKKTKAKLSRACRCHGIPLAFAQDEPAILYVCDCITRFLLSRRLFVRYFLIIMAN